MFITKIEEHQHQQQHSQQTNTNMNLSSSAAYDKYQYRQSITDISDHDVVLLLNDVFAMHPKATFIKNEKHTTTIDTKDLTSFNWRDSITSFINSTQSGGASTPITVSVTSKDIIVTADITASCEEEEKDTKDKENLMENKEDKVDVECSTTENSEETSTSNTTATVPTTQVTKEFPKLQQRPCINLKERSCFEFYQPNSSLISTSSLEITSGLSIQNHRKSIDASSSTRVSISMPSISSLLSGDEPLTPLASSTDNNEIPMKQEINTTVGIADEKQSRRANSRKRQATLRPTSLDTISEPYGALYSNNCAFAPKLSTRENQTFSFELSPSSGQTLPAYGVVNNALPSSYTYERRMTYPFIDINPPTANYPPSSNEIDQTSNEINRTFQSPPLPYLNSLSGASQVLSPLAASRRSLADFTACSLDLPSNVMNSTTYFYDEEFAKRADGISTDAASSTLFSFPPLSSSISAPPQQSIPMELTPAMNHNSISTEDETKTMKKDGKGKNGGTMLCKIPGCFKKRKLGGRCIAHGGGKRCIVVHCMKSAQSYGLCKAHGGGIRCTYQNCTKSSQGNGFCRAHGGGKRCRAENCDKGAQRGEYCAIHGGVKRCQHPNCHRVERGGGFCQVHRQKKTCTFKGCNDVATKYFLCARHLQQ